MKKHTLPTEIKMTTPQVFKSSVSFFKSTTLITLAILLSHSMAINVWAQTITDVYPTRVTNGSTITIEGTDFTQAIANTIRFDNGGGMDAGSKSVSADGTRMFFIIGRSNVTTNTPATAVAPEDLTRQLQVDLGSGLIDVEISNQPVDITYIAPTAMIHAVSSAPANIIDGRILAPNRVEEIYTDYGGLKRYEQGDAFNRGDFNSGTFGRWEFFGLQFPAVPTGILVEAGGRGRGMFIGFNSSGDFVARGGDGRTVTANGCARLVLPASTFAGKNGRLLVTLEPRQGLLTSGQLTIEWDEDDDGSIDYSNTITAASNYLGYDSFREWSGGNAGFVGKSNGNIAGSEVSGAATFNGTIDYMTFSNFEDTPIAWRSSWGTYSNQPASERPDNPIIPDNYHDLLGFKYDGIVYATGADNDLLEEFLGSEIVDGSGDPIPGQYDRTRFKAYSTNGVQNTTVKQHHIFTGEYVDGKELEGTVEFRSAPNIDPNDEDYEPAFANIRSLSMFDVLVDGKNGLNIGSGINNLNQTTEIQFFSGNGEVGNAADEVPDLLIPNMAEAGGTDVYYYSDELGNIVGRPISIRINNSDAHNPPLSHWQNDQYRVTFPGVSFNDAEPIERIYGNAQQRPMRLIAFKLSDFGIGDNVNPAFDITSIENINAGAGGTADIPFLAYNGATFQIRSPEVRVRPSGRSICEVPSNIDVAFTVAASVDGGFSFGDSDELEKERLTFEWFRFNTLIQTDSDVSPSTAPIISPSGENAISSYTVTDVGVEELGLYRIRISNDYGTTIVTVPIEEGGVPAIWDGTQWNFPSGYVAEGTPNPGSGITVVADEDRRLIWQEDVIINGSDVVGCDCVIPSGKTVEITNQKALRLYGQLSIGPATPELDDDGNPTGAMTPAGQLIINDGASLIQTKDTDVNSNVGEIDMKRTTSNLKLYDYIYWSSPVADFELSDIPNDRSYLWDVRAVNANGTDGNWNYYTGAMDMGRGYIARVPSAADFTVDYKGVPNNGRILQPALTSVGSQDVGDKHWNLVGNPYPSAISAEKFLTHPANSMLTGAVYIWSRSGALSSTNQSPYYQDFGYNYADSFITYNSVGSVPADSFSGNIAAGQGFFVKVADGVLPGNVEFRNTMRSGVSDSVLDNTEFYRTSEGNTTPEPEPEKERVWLSIVDANDQSASTLIGYIDGATTGMDRLYEAFLNKGPNELAIYSPFEQGRMVIQGRPLPFDDTDVVNLGVQIPATGEYTIGIDKLDGEALMEEDLPIILEDLLTGLTYNLKEAPATITIDEGAYEDRFVLRYNANQLSTKDVDTTETIAYIKDDILHVQSSMVIDKVQVYDMTGKRVMEYEPETNRTIIQTDFNFSRGVYITLISLNGEINISKKLIN
ncbi:hypothetical protein [Winogradskyella aurantiaca]|uniref:hypothetical protein n=1 Tax=Winogradskyella aurantiaca TaxID=2219558 RepID=UPI0013009B9C|nr:hypothetical protein [Winogradskyella aurantiaca]